MYIQRPIRIVTVAWNKVGMRALSRPAGKSESLSLSFTTGGKPMQLQRAEMSLKDKSDIALKLSEAKDGFNVEWGKNDWKGNASWLLSVRDSENNVYRRFLPMATRNEEYDVTFYPEGGYLLNGLECRVAFKAMGRTGNAATISLDVVDEAGEIIIPPVHFMKEWGHLC